MMPPGLYEAVIAVSMRRSNTRSWSKAITCSGWKRARSSDIRAIVDNSPEDDSEFAAAARVSEINQALYTPSQATGAGMAATEQGADTLRRIHPSRLRFAIFPDANPWMQPVEAGLPVAGPIAGRSVPTIRSLVSSTSLRT